MSPTTALLLLFVKKNGKSQTQVKSPGLVETSCKYLWLIDDFKHIQQYIKREMEYK